MPVLWKVLVSATLLILPLGAYVAGKIVGPYDTATPPQQEVPSRAGPSSATPSAPAATSVDARSPQGPSDLTGLATWSVRNRDSGRPSSDKGARASNDPGRLTPDARARRAESQPQPSEQSTPSASSTDSPSPSVTATPSDPGTESPAPTDSPSSSSSTPSSPDSQAAPTVSGASE